VGLDIDSTRYLVMDIMGEGSYGQVFKCLNLITGKTTAVKIHKDGESESILWEMEMLQAIRSLDTKKKNIALKDLGIMHLDLKPDNVMLVNHKDQPFRIKLIDFGLAHPVGLLKAGVEMQAVPYRAPEVMLGLPLSEAVDVWGVGCIMGFMYFGDHLWRLKTRGEYEDATGIKPDNLKDFLSYARNLEDAVARWYEKRGDTEYEDRMAFLSLLKGCLHFDPARRICSGEALKHRFITMVHLVDEMGTSSYVDAALQLMTVSYLHQSVHTESSSEDEDTLGIV
uniref:Protein kinase domain-containing protein n=1 Tax=Mastacembelus armatus TaxID=205130 RepID=A0A7N9ASC7_9TELE